VSSLPLQDKVCCARLRSEGEKKGMGFTRGGIKRRAMVVRGGEWGGRGGIWGGSSTVGEGQE